MEAFQFWSLVLQAVTLVLVAGTLYVYWLILQKMQDQAKTMQDQVTAVMDGSSAQNAIAVINFIQQEQFRKARQTVITRLESKKEPWSNDEKIDASLVCSSYDILAIFVRKKLVSKDIIVDEWGPSILRTYNVLSSFMDEYRANMGPRYWDDFPWLAAEVENSGITVKRPAPTELAEKSSHG